MPAPLEKHELSLFARRLRLVREHYAGSTGEPNLAAGHFATRLGISAWAYRRYERGEIDPPMTVLQAIRAMTGISLDYLVCGRANGDDCLAGEEVLNRISLGLRLQWARQVFEPILETCAHVMGVPPVQWRRYEEDVDPLPLGKAQEFAHRFKVTLDFLYRGSLAGLRQLAPAVLDELLRQHPELAAAEAEAAEGWTRATRIDKAERRHRDGGSRRRADEYRGHETAEPTLLALPVRREG